MAQSSDGSVRAESYAGSWARRESHLAGDAGGLLTLPHHGLPTTGINCCPRRPDQGRLSVRPVLEGCSRRGGNSLMARIRWAIQPGLALFLAMFLTMAPFSAGPGYALNGPDLTITLSHSGHFYV